jgi:hypothetical protein
MVIRASAENTKGGEGVVWLKNEPYDNTDGHMGAANKRPVYVEGIPFSVSCARYRTDAVAIFLNGAGGGGLECVPALQNGVGERVPRQAQVQD